MWRRGCSRTTTNSYNRTPKQTVVDVEGERRQIRPEVLEQPTHVDAALLVPRRAGVHNDQPPLGLSLRAPTGPESGQPVFQHVTSEKKDGDGGECAGTPSLETACPKDKLCGGQKVFPSRGQGETGMYHRQHRSFTCRVFTVNNVRCSILEPPSARTVRLSPAFRPHPLCMGLRL